MTIDEFITILSNFPKDKKVKCVFFENTPLNRAVKSFRQKEDIDHITTITSKLIKHEFLKFAFVCDMDENTFRAIKLTINSKAQTKERNFTAETAVEGLKSVLDNFLKRNKEYVDKIKELKKDNFEAWDIVAEIDSKIYPIIAIEPKIDSYDDSVTIYIYDLDIEKEEF